MDSPHRAQLQCPYQIHRTVSDQSNISSSFSISNPGVTSVQTSTTLESNGLRVVPCNEGPIDQSSQHPLSHLGAGRFWSPTKESNSWIKRISHRRRNRLPSIFNNQLSPGKSHEHLLARSAVWLEEEYPMHPAHARHTSDLDHKTDYSTSKWSLGGTSDRVQQPQLRGLPGYHDMTPANREEKTRRQLEIIRQEDENKWRPGSRIVELDSISLGTAELYAANLPELSSSHTQIPSHSFPPTKVAHERNELEAPSLESTAYSTPDLFSPAWSERSSKISESTSGYYDLSETSIPLDVDHAFENAPIPIDNTTSVQSPDSSAPIPVSEAGCSGVASQSQFSDLDRIMEIRRFSGR